jgi:hypothetical protein
MDFKCVLGIEAEILFEERKKIEVDSPARRERPTYN